MSASYPDEILFKRLLEGQLSPEETGRLMEWLSSPEAEPAVKKLILAQLGRPVDEEEITPAVREAMERRLPAILGASREVSPSGGRVRPMWRWVAAAVCVGLLGTGIYLFRDRPAPPSIAVRQENIGPARSGAILELSDGSTVVLDSLKDGWQSNQGGAKVSLSKGGLSYKNDAVAGGALLYNRISTPRGRQFQLTLPDGTKVWMNAASSLRYPTAFDGSERKVELTGEAYFEVAGQKKPFIVQINDKMEVDVLGTWFNVNAYADEGMVSATVLDGAIKVRKDAAAAVIRPGQQGVMKSGNADVRVIEHANLDRVMAWKNGVFDFQDATLEEVMRQLQRWYDIDVVYEKEIPKLEFMGKMGRDLSLPEVLTGLEMSKVHFRLEAGRKLVVLP